MMYVAETRCFYCGEQRRCVVIPDATDEYPPQRICAGCFELVLSDGAELGIRRGAPCAFGARDWRDPPPEQEQLWAKQAAARRTTTSACATLRDHQGIGWCDCGWERSAHEVPLLDRVPDGFRQASKDAPSICDVDMPELFPRVRPGGASGFWSCSECEHEHYGMSCTILSCSCPRTKPH